MIEISNLRSNHLGFRRAGVEQELVNLMRCNICENPAVLGALIEPIWARRRMNAMRTQSNSLHDFADCAGLNQFAGLYRRSNLKPFAETNRIDASGFGLHAARLCKLLQRRKARLVAHKILAVFHHLNAQRRTLTRNCRTDDELNGFVLQDFLRAGSSTALAETRWQTPQSGLVQLHRTKRILRPHAKAI